MVRVYAPLASAEAGPTIALPADEAAHVVRVLRLGPGAVLRVFDGRGGEWHATIDTASRGAVTVRLGARIAATTETRIRYTLAVAVLKGDGTDEVVRDATMMGVAVVQPFVSTRAETSLAALARGHRVERWRRVAVAAAKQCGRAVLPDIVEPTSWPDVASHVSNDVRLLCAEPTAGEGSAIADVPAPTSVTLAVGPEGGWTPEELEAAVRLGWRPIQLGRRTLRASATPLAALAACQAVWRDH